MRFWYRKWEGNRLRQYRFTLEDLMSLFSQILTHTSGDIEEALQWLNQLDQRYGLLEEELNMEDFIDYLEEEGYLRRDQAIYQLTSRGGRRIRQDALKQIFTSLHKSQSGSHDTLHQGRGVERLSGTRPYHFGDNPTNIDYTRTINNAIQRAGLEEINLTEEDFEVYETEHLTSCATVLMIDISHSMILYGEDRITPAKQVALALAELITTQYPHDELEVLVFGDQAERVRIDQLPFLQVGPFHTNTKHGLQMARHILNRKRNANKQIFMVTDGKPSAIFDSRGRFYRNSFGLDPKIVNRTLDEAVLCRRHGIVITTFMVARDPYLIGFVKKLAEMNRGRAYYASPDDLGEYVLVDYIRNRRRRVK